LKNVLVVAAHPDDEVLGCGGTIPRLVQEGHKVHISVLGEGVTSRYPQPDQADRALVDALYTCSRRAAELLGAEPPYFCDLPDNRFDSLPLLDIIKAVEGLVERLQPQVIYTHHGGDLNIDHMLACRAVLTATRPVPGCPVKEIYAFEVPSSTEWAFQRLEPAFRPNVFVDISATIEAKLQAMQQYATEVRPFPHPRSPEALQAIARRWGSVVGVEYAEAFELVRLVR
jgi:LmbE family N-acetylglucosaminyl deacetylase